MTYVFAEKRGSIRMASFPRHLRHSCQSCGSFSVSSLSQGLRFSGNPWSSGFTPRIQHLNNRSTVETLRTSECQASLRMRWDVWSADHLGVLVPNCSSEMKPYKIILRGQRWPICQEMSADLNLQLSNTSTLSSTSFRHCRTGVVFDIWLYPFVNRLREKSLLSCVQVGVAFCFIPLEVKRWDSVSSFRGLMWQFCQEDQEIITLGLLNHFQNQTMFNNGSNIIKPWALAHGFMILEPLFK